MLACYMSWVILLTQHQPVWWAGQFEYLEESQLEGKKKRWIPSTMWAVTLDSGLRYQLDLRCSWNLFYQVYSSWDCKLRSLTAIWWRMSVTDHSQTLQTMFWYSCKLLHLCFPKIILNYLEQKKSVFNSSACSRMRRVCTWMQKSIPQLFSTDRLATLV